MKRYHKIFCTAALCITISGCDYLDSSELSMVGEEDVWKNMTYITQEYVNTYSYLPSGYALVGNSLIACATDEAEAVLNEEAVQNYNMGNWSKYSNPDDRWSTFYNGIRQCCVLRDGIKKTNWEIYKYSDPTVYEQRITSMKEYSSEARFLKAFYYAELVKRFGGVPLIHHVLDLENADDYYYLTHLTRNTFEECVNFIADECDVVKDSLLIVHPNASKGKANIGAALSLKSRILLLAASDLYNQSGNNNPYIGYTDVTEGKRAERWLAAAQAAQAVIDMNRYSLNPTYQDLFTMQSNNTSCPENIWERRLPASNVIEVNNYPIGYDKGKTGTCPTQNLVDDYEMIDGSRFDWDNPEHAANPYDNRDPRLKATILVNNEMWAGRPVETWEGGLDGLPRKNASKTGYYLKKFLVDGLNIKDNLRQTRLWIYFRYAEILLNYAEAANRYGGPNYTVAGAQHPMTPVEAVNLIRERVGMPDVAATFANRGIALTRENLADLIDNERRIELAFEDFRWWDARRQMKGEEAFGGEIRGVAVSNNNDGTFSYTVKHIENRSFDASKMYFYPIPQSEISKSNDCLQQNPNW